MKRTIGTLMCGVLLATAVGACTSYTGVAQVGDKAVVAKNNTFFFGVFRRVYVCKITDNGLQSCQRNEAP